MNRACHIILKKDFVICRGILGLYPNNYVFQTLKFSRRVEIPVANNWYGKEMITEAIK